MLKCKCIEKNLKALKKQFGDDAEFLNVKIMHNFITGKHWQELAPLRFRYHRKNKNGSKSKLWSTSFIYSNFCPNCGKPHVRK